MVYLGKRDLRAERLSRITTHLIMSALPLDGAGLRRGVQVRKLRPLKEAVFSRAMSGRRAEMAGVGSAVTGLARAAGCLRRYSLVKWVTRTGEGASSLDSSSLDSSSLDSSSLDSSSLDSS